MKLYHATYRPLIRSIKKHGLGGKASRYRWCDSKDGVVYLATDAGVAESYAEVNEEVPEEWTDDIVIFCVDSDSLDNDKLFIDDNVLDNDGSTLEYHGVIPYSALRVVDVLDERVQMFVGSLLN